MEWVPICDDERYIKSKKMTPAIGEEISPEDCFAIAYSCALQGAGRVASNPLVGVVAVDRDHKFIGLGAHLQFGKAHAEASLISDIQENGLESRLTGATVYCTLEPCSFHGKTPSCAKLLRGFPIKKLVYGHKDPNLRVNGSGIKILEDAGIICVQDQRFAKDSAKLIKPFTWCLSRAQPYVGLKVAMSFDGKIGKTGQERLWVTGERSRQYAHWLRHYYEGILIGADTVIVDNPSLNIRHPYILSPSPVAKIVLDPSGRAFRSRSLSKHRLIASLRADDRVFWIVKKGLNQEIISEMEKQLEHHGASLIQLNYDHQGLDLNTLLQTLYKSGVHSILLEGGRYVWSSFLNQQLVQVLHAFHAGTILGGESTLRWDAGLTTSIGTQLVEKRISPMDSDWVLEADLNYFEGDA